MYQVLLLMLCGFQGVKSVRVFATLVLFALFACHIHAQLPAAEPPESQSSTANFQNFADGYLSWRLPVAERQSEAKRITALCEERENIAPQLRAAAATGFVFMRTTDNMFGVNIKTGKRVFSPSWYVDIDETPHATDDWLRQQVWGDAGYGRLTTDGQRVYGIMATAKRGAPERRNERRLHKKYSSEIFALEIASYGRMVWRLGSQSSTEPKLRHAKFLGPPIAFDGVVYALAMIGLNQFLVAVQPDSGKLKWLADLGLANQLKLRMDGVHPKVSSGIAICPVSVAKIAAVDITTKETIWTFQCDESGDPMFGWLDTQTEIVGDYVLATNRLRSKLHSIDLNSGKLNWKKEEPQGLYVQAIDAKTAIVVSSKSASLINVADASECWKKKVEYLAAPSGRGTFQKGQYFLPLASGDLLQIDLKNGNVMKRTKHQRPLGNLIIAEGRLNSSSAEYVESFRLPMN